MPARRSSPADRRGAHPNTQLAQLSLDADASPPRVLPRQAHDQFDDLGVDRRSSLLPTPSVDPLSARQVAVPAKERLRTDNERRPSVSGKGPARRGEEHPVERCELHAAGLTTQNPQLMPQDQDLEVKGRGRIASWQGVGPTPGPRGTGGRASRDRRGTAGVGANRRFGPPRDYPAQEEVEEGADHGAAFADRTAVAGLGPRSGLFTPRVIRPQPHALPSRAPSVGRNTPWSRRYDPSSG